MHFEVPSRVCSPLLSARTRASGWLATASLAAVAACAQSDGAYADVSRLKARGLDLTLASAPEQVPETESDAGAPQPDAAPPPAPALRALEGELELSEPELWARLAESSAICLGEVHDNGAQHRVERQALDAVAERARGAGRSLALGFEMFQRNFQPALTAYARGKLDEAALLAETEYAARWGFDFAFYRPLLEGARDLGLPALALNARLELARAVARGGLAGLDEALRTELPELNLDDAEHQAYVYGLLGTFPEHAAELGVENIYVAQTVRDETMAGTAAEWLTGAGETAQLLLFAGAAHCHESAIPRRITRRSQRDVLSVALLSESELAAPETSLAGYDVWIILPD